MVMITEKGADALIGMRVNNITAFVRSYPCNPFGIRYDDMTKPEKEWLASLLCEATTYIEELGVEKHEGRQRQIPEKVQ